MEISNEQLVEIAENLKELNATKYKMEQISRQKMNNYKEAIDDMVDAIRIALDLE